MLPIGAWGSVTSLPFKEFMTADRPTKTHGLTDQPTNQQTDGLEGLELKLHYK